MGFTVVRDREAVICRVCGHPDCRHDAGECWTDEHGDETWGDTSCSCAWYEPEDAR